MAANHVYTCRWTDRQGWRWAVAVRPAADGDGEVTTYTEVVVPSGVIQMRSMEASYANKPYGLSEATAGVMIVRLDELTGGELPFLRDRLVDSCLVNTNGVSLNTVVVTSDVGNAALAESAWPVVGVFAQPPTVERELPLKPGVAVDIELVDAAQVALENARITDQWSVPGGSLQYGYPVPADRLQDMVSSVYNVVMIGTGRTRFVMRNLLDSMRTMALRVGSIAYQAVRKRALVPSGWQTEHEDHYTTPFGDHWTFYGQDATTADIGVAATPALTAADLWYIMFQDLAGFELGKSQYNLSQRYDNWWNALQDLAEVSYSKARIVWHGTGVTAVPMPAVQYDKLWGGFGESPLSVHVATPGNLDTLIGPTYRAGFEVLRSGKVLELPRNKESGQSFEDATEWQFGSSTSIAKTEYGVPALWFSNMPEARDLTGGIGAVGGFQRNIWFGTLYSQPESKSFVRLHHRIELHDGVEGHSVDVPAMVVDGNGRVNGQGRRVWASRIQREHGGMAGVLAKAVYRSFGRRNQAKLTFAQLGEGRTPWLLSALGRTVTIGGSGSVEEMYGTDQFSEPGVVTRVAMDLGACRTEVDVFIRGSRGPL